MTFPPFTRSYLQKSLQFASGKLGRKVCFTASYQYDCSDQIHSNFEQQKAFSVLDYHQCFEMGTFRNNASSYWNDCLEHFSAFPCQQCPTLSHHARIRVDYEPGLWLDWRICLRFHRFRGMVLPFLKSNSKADLCRFSQHGTNTLHSELVLWSVVALSP